jgi:hypothetical protein
LANAFATVDMAALHAIGPGDVIAECVEHTIDVTRVEAVIDCNAGLRPIRRFPVKTRFSNWSGE